MPLPSPPAKAGGVEGQLIDVETPKLTPNLPLPPSPSPYATFSSSSHDNIKPFVPQDNSSENPILNRYNVLDEMDQRRKLALRFKDLPREAQVKVLADPEFKTQIEIFPEIFRLTPSPDTPIPAPLKDTNNVSTPSPKVLETGIGGADFEANLRRRSRKR